jgi:hypothetical protein
MRSAEGFEHRDDQLELDAFPLLLCPACFHQKLQWQRIRFRYLWPIAIEHPPCRLHTVIYGTGYSVF